MEQCVYMETEELNVPKITEDKQLLPEHIRQVFARSKCLYSKAEVESALDKMALQINTQLSEQNPIFLGVVLGGIVPLGNLLLRLDFPLEIDYVHATRYRKNIVGKQLHWLATPNSNLKNRVVIVVDDILDGGITLSQIVEYCWDRGAKEVLTAALVDKCDARLPGGLLHADFVGLKVENHYVFGYGLDYKGYLRNAPGIYQVPDEFIEG